VNSFWSELKRRHVTRVAVAYVVVGWLLAQVAEFATETFGAPSWVLRSFVVLLVLGLPVAVLLAWVFDLTPQGVRRTDDAPSEPASKAAPSAAGRLVFVAFLLVAGAAAGWMQFYGPEPQSPARGADATSQTVASAVDDETSLHFDLAFPEDAPLALIGAAELGNGKRAFAISPNGRLVVYVGSSDGQYRLYLRDLAADTTTRLPGTEGAFHPFFAPNNNWIGFFISNALYKVHVSGSEPVFVSEAINTVGAGWTDRDEIVMVIEEGGKMVRVSASGGMPEVVNDELRNLYLDVIHGTNKIISNGNLIDPSTGEVTTLPVRSNDMRFANGFLLFTELGTLRAARYDLETNTLLGQPVPVLTGVRTEIWGQGQWSVSASGTLLYMPGGDARANPMHWVSVTERTPLDLPTRFRGSMEISPEGDRIAVAEFNGQSDDIWIYELVSGRASKLTTDGRSTQPLFWAPDGLSVYYQKRDESNTRTTYRSFIDSQAPAERVLAPEAQSYATAISSDGRYLGVVEADGVSVHDLETQERIAIPATVRGDWGSAVAPQGRAIVYTSSVTGAYHNFLQPVPPTGKRFQVSRDDGAEEPRWSPDGRAVYYRSGSRIMKVVVTYEPEISLGEPEVFFSGVFENVSGRSFDIHPDGQRALVIYSEDLAPSIRVVTHWFREVEAMVGDMGQGSP
jgi:serine/threonine-protein kinase